MPRPADFSAELILSCNSLEAGGIERVVSTLANEWFVDARKLAFAPNPLVLTNGNGHAPDEDEAHAPSESPFIPIVGRLVWDKSHDVLLEAMSCGLPVVVSTGHAAWRA